MRSLLITVLFVPLVSCGSSASSGKSSVDNAGGSDSGEATDEGGDETGEGADEEPPYAPDFAAISARCYDAHDAQRQARYACCMQRLEWEDEFTRSWLDEEYCNDQYLDTSEPDLYCEVAEIQETYSRIVDDGLSVACIEERLSWYEHYSECIITAQADCGSESAYDEALERSIDCNNMGTDSPDCE